MVAADQQPGNRGRKTRIITNSNPYNPHYLYIYSLFVNSSKKNRTICQADVTATPLASFALKMAAEAVETSAATNFSPEISTSLSFFLIVIPDYLCFPLSPKALHCVCMCHFYWYLQVLLKHLNKRILKWITYTLNSYR